MSKEDMSVEDLLSCNHFNTDEKNPHIIVNPDSCTGCKVKPCLTCCPAQLYKQDRSSGIVHFDHLGCLECGTCRLVCQEMGNGGITQWKYPLHSFGVQYRCG